MWVADSGTRRGVVGQMKGVVIAAVCKQGEGGEGLSGSGKQEGREQVSQIHYFEIPLSGQGPWHNPQLPSMRTITNLTLGVCLSGMSDIQQMTCLSCYQNGELRDFC